MSNEFVKQDEVTEYIEEKISLVLKSGPNDLLSELFYAEDIAKCDRMLYYKSVNLLTFANKFEGYCKKSLIWKWKEIFSKSSSVEVLDCSYITSDHNYNCSSTIDLIIRINGSKAVVLIKEIDEELFNNGKTTRSHVVELMSQMWMLEVNDGILIYENNKKYKLFHVLPNKNVINAIKEKLQNLYQKKQMGILPERKYKKSDGKECQSCQFRKVCWKE